jgi:hypothetical protein
MINKLELKKKVQQMFIQQVIYITLYILVYHFTRSSQSINKCR